MAITANSASTFDWGGLPLEDDEMPDGEVTAWGVKQLKREFEKRSYIEKYIPHIGIALQEILDLSEPARDKTVERLEDVLHKSRKF